MLLVVGSTGELGGRVVRLLLGQGHEVRCLVRPGSNGERLAELGAKVVRGDLTDPGSLADACQGVDTVIATATAIGQRLAGQFDMTAGKVSVFGSGNTKVWWVSTDEPLRQRGITPRSATDWVHDQAESSPPSG